MSFLLRTLAVAAALSVAAGTEACTCGEMSVDTAKQNADVVFAGTVAGVEVVDSEDDWEPRIVVRFDVARVWKGDVGAVFVMHTNYEASSCGGFFREMLSQPGPLLVYAYGRAAAQWKARAEGGAVGAGSFTRRGPATQPRRSELLESIADDAIAYTTDICTRTQPVLHAVDDFDQLGDAREFAPLSTLPDRALVESLRPKFNEAPRQCGDLSDAKVWRVLPQAPANAATLLALLEDTPRDPALEYREYWFAAEDGRLGFCRAPTDQESDCGLSDTQFEPDAATPGGWSISASSVSTYCPGLSENPET
ncbi:MAG TPA: hypothetical protein VN259_14815, partial [Xanthomonadales bacterium]|nr:hypothetical protein [Xanthomonadales bacterium]